ncbi:MAG TPA: hypothetical protein VMZ28_04240 [Kofleriaceae bacterium]|nr:hypothetical protein [Kofleriaceae bacterium]
MTRLAALLIAVIASSGCASDGADEPSCEPGDSALPESGIAIGVGDPGAFREVEDAGTLELVLGNQGGWMVLPVMRLEMGDVDMDCLSASVGVDLRILDSDLTAAVPETQVAFTEANGAWYSDPLYVFLSLDVADLEGQHAALAASVSLAGDDAVVEVDDVTLVNAE